MAEVEKLHGLHNTGMTMHERFTVLAQQSVGGRGKRSPLAMRTRSQANPALIEALYNQLENQVQSFQPFQGWTGGGRGGLRRSGSEGSIRSVGLRRGRSNSFGDMGAKDQKWRRSNGNLSMNGSLYSDHVSSVQTRGYWLRGDSAPRRAAPRGRGARGRGRGRGGRGRVHLGRVNRITAPAARARPARGVGRRGARRSVPAAAGRAPAAAGRAPAAAGRAWGRQRGPRRGRGRGRGGTFRTQPQKPIPTKEELDAQLEQYMAGTKAALDKELDDYMRSAMDI